MLALALGSLLCRPFLPEVAITVDAASKVPISPYIYGANHPEWDKTGELFTIARQGGNRMTAYNWETNASNAGSDWHHQNDGYLGESNEAGWITRTFLEAAQNHHAAAILTIPTAGYVAADKNGDGDVNKTPDYLNKRFLKSFAKKPSGKYQYPPDVKDKAVYQDEFVSWLEKIKSPKTPVFFSLDNEPDLWGSTHARIWPKAPTYAQIIANNIEFATAIKAVAPKALIFGPANYGWQGFKTFQNASDANGRDFLDVYLAAMRDAEKKAGKRLLDVLDIHWYPEAQGDGIRITFTGEKDKPGTKAARVQAPRSLWDPTYVEDSWIANSIGKKPIVLLPNLIAQIKRQYPNTRLAITEYNYGGGDDISGALAQADVLGLFGRYGLFAACNWGVGPKDVGQLAGFKAYTDYDGKGAKFGNLSLGVRGTKPAEDSVYASLDTSLNGLMTLVIVNKTKEPRTYRISTPGYTPRAARAFIFSTPNLTAAAPTKANVLPGGASVSVPSESITTLELKV